ncbi:MAG: carboxypeptidase-like regulatory domain-containing protein [Bryobacterales bacterium]
MGILNKNWSKGVCTSYSAAMLPADSRLGPDRRHRWRRDGQAAAVPASRPVTNEGTGASRGHDKRSGAARYSSNPGNYRVSAEAAGFRLVRNDVVLQVSAVLAVDFTLGSAK